MMSELKHTHRNFRFYEFEDRNGYACSLQKSSIATCIWLGLDSASPKSFIYGKGWVDVSKSMPEGVNFNTRMHLTQDQAKILGKQLLLFAETGELTMFPKE